MHRPILIDLPMPILTPRLIIRPCQPNDGLLINKAVKESFKQLKKWLPWAQIVPTREMSEEAARRFYVDYILRESCHMLILLKGSKADGHQSEFVGMCAYQTLAWDIPSGDIGYWLKESALGQGFMTEAVQALVLYAFGQMGLKRLTLTCHDENVKSWSVAERAGFVLEKKAKGLLASGQGHGLKMCRQYVRFDGKDIPHAGITWPKL